MANKTALSLVLLVGLLLLVSSLACAGVIEDANQLVETGEVENIREAIGVFRGVLDSKPKNGDALWMLAKAHLYLGDRREQDKLEIYEEGKEYAEQAVEVVPDSADANYWLAALIGRVGQTKGILQSLFMVSPMKDALDKTLELDPDYAAAYFVLSLLYKEAPGWPLSIGNEKKALENAIHAVELDPTDPEFSYHLAELYVDNKQEAEAVEVLQEMLALPDIDEHPEFKTSGLQLLGELSK